MPAPPFDRCFYENTERGDHVGLLSRYMLTDLRTRIPL